MEIEPLLSMEIFGTLGERPLRGVLNWLLLLPSWAFLVEMLWVSLSFSKLLLLPTWAFLTQFNVVNFSLFFWLIWFHLLVFFWVWVLWSQFWVVFYFRDCFHFSSDCLEKFCSCCGFFDLSIENPVGILWKSRQEGGQHVCSRSVMTRFLKAQNVSIVCIISIMQLDLMVFRWFSLVVSKVMSLFYGCILHCLFCSFVRLFNHDLQSTH